MYRFSSMSRIERIFRIFFGYERNFALSVRKSRLTRETRRDHRYYYTRRIIWHSVVSTLRTRGRVRLGRHQREGLKRRRRGFCRRGRRVLAEWLVAFIAMQMASTLRAGRNERKRGSGTRETETEREREKRTNQERTRGRDHRRMLLLLCCCCCCRCCVRVHARFFLSAFGLSITGPFPPSRGARTRAYGRPIAVSLLSLREECEYTCIYFLHERVGEIASSVRNGACAPYAAFYFSAKKGTSYVCVCVYVYMLKVHLKFHFRRIKCE